MRSILHTDAAHLLPAEGQDLGQELVVVLHIGAGHIPRIPHDLLVLGQQLTQPAAELAGAVPRIPAEQQEIGVLVFVEGVVQGVDVELPQVIAAQVEQPEVLKPVSVLEVIYIGHAIVLQLDVHYMAVVGVIPQRINVSDLRERRVFIEKE